MTRRSVPANHPRCGGHDAATDPEARPPNGGATLLLLALIELALAAAGIEALRAQRDPFAGFSQRVRVFRPDPARGVYATPPAAVERSFNYQEFRLDKPGNGFRIFTLGGSSD